MSSESKGSPPLIHESKRAPTTLNKNAVTGNDKGRDILKAEKKMLSVGFENIRLKTPYDRGIAKCEIADNRMFFEQQKDSMDTRTI